MARRLIVNQLAYDTVIPTLNGDSARPVTGLTYSNFTADVVINGGYMPWEVLSSANVNVMDVLPNKIYVNEVSIGSGVYSIKWWPSQVGFFHIIMKWTAGNQYYDMKYDIVPSV